MRRKILMATGIVVAITLLVGAATAFVMARSITAAAEEELVRQARVTAELIEEDLEDLKFRPGSDAPDQIERFRNDLNRSLNRARVVGGHDVVEAVLRLPNRIVPITEPLVVMSALPSDVAEGDVVTVDLDGRSMLVAVEQAGLGRIDVVVAIGRLEPLLPVKQLTMSLLAALGIGAILTVSLGIWLSRSLTSRLSDMSVVAAEVGAGDFTARASVSGDDEVTELARSFNQMAEQLEDVRVREREFLMAVSHDLRTPLTTISGYAEALDSGDIEPDDLSRVAEVLHRQTAQLARLIEDLMSLARLDAREFALAPEVVDVAGLTGGIVDTYLPRAEVAVVDLSSTCDDPLRVVVDPLRLTQVLGNLLDNALRYTPENGRISVSCMGSGDRASISIVNSGPGISDDDLPHVFERLYVADRYRAQRPSGSGLGLAIVGELVDAMDGTVTCTSDPNAGTTFTVTIG
jgi:signal transduction histidine kinase